MNIVAKIFLLQLFMVSLSAILALQETFFVLYLGVICYTEQ